MTLIEAVGIVVIVIFLFLASFRSVIIPVVTIPLSLIGVCTLMLMAGLQLQPADAARDGARHRPCGRRRHRGGGEHPPPSRGGQIAGAGLAAGRARNRRPRHLDDDHAGRRVRADRLPRRPDRLAVPRIRLYAGGLGDRVRRDRADAVADDVLGVPQERGRGAFRQARQSRVRRDDALVRPQARPLARLQADHAAVRGNDPVPRRLPLYAHLQGARAGRGSGHRVLGDQGAEIRQHRLSQFLRREARPGVSEIPGDRPALRAERHQRRAERHRRHAAASLGRAQAFVDQAETAGAGRAVQDRGRSGLRLQPAAAAGRAGRPAGADGDQLHRRLPRRL